MNEEKIERGEGLFKELVEILKALSDSEVGKLQATGVINDFFRAILEPLKVKEYPNIAEFLFANKTRATLIAMMRYAITHNYSFKVTKEGQVRYVSPDFNQWFEDGVMFLEGKEPFAGFIGLYRNRELRYAIAARQMRGGEKVKPEDLEFVSIDEFRKRIQAIPQKQIIDLDGTIRELKELLNSRDENESSYQKWFQKHYWVFGLQYKSIDNHTTLDDKNIPDFTGKRVHDGNRDIFEIKQPFLKICRQDGGFHSGFNDAWNQVEKYLNFTREEKDYLRRKDLIFDNPRCYLIMGFGCSEEEMKKIRTKERVNPSIKIYTYNELLVFAESTIEFIRREQTISVRELAISLRADITRIKELAQLKDKNEYSQLEKYIETQSELEPLYNFVDTLLKDIPVSLGEDYERNKSSLSMLGDTDFVIRVREYYDMLNLWKEAHQKLRDRKYEHIEDLKEAFAECYAHLESIITRASVLEDEL